MYNIYMLTRDYNIYSTKPNSNIFISSKTQSIRTENGKVSLHSFDGRRYKNWSTRRYIPQKIRENDLEEVKKEENIG